MNLGSDVAVCIVSMVSNPTRHGDLDAISYQRNEANESACWL